MAELHIIGTLLGASHFPHSELSCKFAMIAGGSEGHWECIEGETSGQTQVDVPEEDGFTVWNHPIDIHYSTKSIEGWPKLQVQVFRQDAFGRNELYGYGFIHMPTVPGTYQLECVTWRPAGGFMDTIWSYFLGASPQLKNLELIHTPTDRFRLTTVSMGKVHLEVTIITRFFENYGVQLSAKQPYRTDIKKNHSNDSLNHKTAM